MTAPQQPEPGKHCGHECVCMSFSNNKLQKFARPCVIDTCQHDTRQRNVPEGLAAASTDELIGELSKREGVLIVGYYPKGVKIGIIATNEPTTLISVVEGGKP